MTRFAVTVLLSVGVATVTACSLFSSTECGGQTETQLLSQLLVESGAPGAAVLAARYSNNPLLVGLTAMALGGNPEETVALVKTAKSLAASKGSAIELRGVITKEKKSRKSVVCSAEAFFAAAAPPSYPTDPDSSKAWKGAAETHWSIAYTAEITDKGDEVYVKVQSADCVGPACELVTKLAELGKKLQGQDGDEIIRQAADASEASAIATLRAINSGQAVFASSCGQGYYGRTLAVLATAPEGSDSFIAEELRPATGEAKLRKAGYEIEMTAPSDATNALPPCNGLAPAAALSSTYKVLACPQSGGPGKRCFTTDAAGMISAGPSSNGPWEPLAK
jgi:hypothetical protein